MTPEHRGSAPTGRIHLEFDLGEMGEMEYHVDVEIRKAEGNALRKALRDLVTEQPGISVPDAVSVLEISRDRLIRLCDRMDFEVKTGKSGGQKGRPALRIYPSSSDVSRSRKKPTNSK